MTVDTGNQDESWTASYYFVSVDLRCDMTVAWTRLLDYRTWNPSFQGAQVTHISGIANGAGERVMIGKAAEFMDGERVPSFYADTIALDHHRRQVIWYVFPESGRMFRNFVDFRLVPMSDGVRFEISYYEQNLLDGEVLRRHRVDYEADLKSLTVSFKAYCEGQT